MTKYHFNPRGMAGVCEAKPGNCPFGFSEDEHYPSAESARAGYEKTQSTVPEPIKPAKVTAYYDHEIPLDKDTEELLEFIEKSGFDPNIVGGTVRDSLAKNIQPKDVDIEVHGGIDMDGLIKLLRKGGYKVDEVGKQFGVLKTVLNSGMDIDISLPRRDNLVGKGHRDFEVTVDTEMTLEEASERRDFTVNAIYYSHSKRQIMDPVGGVKDWEDKKLRPVGEAFKEDPLRVLRGVQFASRFGLNPSREFIEVSREIKDQYGSLSEERVQEEFSKLFLKGKEPVAGLVVLRETQWGDHFGMDKQWFEDQNLRKMKAHFKGLENLARDRELPKDVLFAAYLAKTLPVEKRKSFTKKALIGDKPQNRALRLAAAPILEEKPTPKSVKKWARELGAQGITVKEWSALHRTTYGNNRVQELESLAVETNSFERPNPDLVTGAMLLDITGEKKGGKWIGQMMRKAAEAQDDEVFTTQAGALDWAKKNIGSYKD